MLGKRFCLCRIVELTGGSITLDGIDIAAIGLQDLRSSLSFVAQDPVVFSGSVRKNLDPMVTCSDDAIATALRQAGLEEWVGGLEVCCLVTCVSCACARWSTSGWPCGCSYGLETTILRSGAS